MRFLLLGIVATGIFTIFVTVFAASAQASAVRLLPKWVWVVLCLLVTPIGGLLYITLGRPIGDGPSGRGGSGGRGPIAPDDDPEFLRNLADRLKKDGDQK